MRLALLLLLTAGLAACRDPMQERERSGFDDFAARGGRALEVVSGRDDFVEEDPVSPYERGVRDGLRGADFDQDERSAAYARGYEAGARERRRDRQSRPAEDRPAERRRSDERAAEVRRAEQRRVAETRVDPRLEEEADDYRRVGASFAASPGVPPRDSMRACAEQAEAMYGLPEGSAAAVSSRARDNGGWLVDVRAGPRQATCVLTADGDVRSVDER